MGIPLRVLLVQASEDDATLVLAELRRGGFEPRHERVDTAGAMAASLATRQWELVIADYSLPQFSAQAALELVHSCGLDLVFIIVSGTGDERAAVVVMQAGAHDYVLKSNLKRLVPCVERELRKARKRAEYRLVAATDEKAAGFGGQRNLTDPTAPSGERLRAAIVSARMYVWNCDIASGRLIRSGDLRMHGSTATLLEGTYSELLGEIRLEDREAFKNAIDRATRMSVPWAVEFRIVEPGGDVHWLETTGEACYDALGRAERLVGVTHEVTGRKRNEELLEHLAFVDLPTGLPNRNGLFEQLGKRIREHAGRAATLALLLLDLEPLREIQHTLSTRQGDALLKEVGRRLRSAIPDADVVARSGEEFAVIIGNLAGHVELGAIAQRVQNVLHAPIVVECVPIVLETAVGVALCPKHGTDPATLLQRADIARHAARSRGTGHAVYEASFQQQSLAGLSRMAELRVAIDRGELLLHFQPMIDLKSHTVCSVEAFVRWQHPALGMIGPEEFIVAAERSGVIQPLAAWVIQAALQQSATWAKRGLRLTIAVNLSARNLLDPQLPQRITTWMRHHGVRADAIAVEITESATMTDPARGALVLRRLNDIGMKISIDDFGVGYSSLSYLRRLPVDRLKVDRSFVANMTRNSSDAMIVRSIIELAHNLGLEVIAEGVETQEVYTQLAEWGCDAVQGYFISQPLPADQLADWMRISRWKPAR